MELGQNKKTEHPKWGQTLGINSDESDLTCILFFTGALVLPREAFEILQSPTKTDITEGN